MIILNTLGIFCGLFILSSWVLQYMATNSQFSREQFPSQPIPRPPSEEKKEEKEVRDILYPARELAKAAQDAERQRKWEEEQAQYERLKQLRQSFNSSSIPLPSPNGSNQNSFSSQNNEFYRPTAPLPKPGEFSQTSPSSQDSFYNQNSSFSSSNGNVNPNSFADSFASLINQSPSSSNGSHYDLPPLDSSSMPSFSDSYNVPSAYQQGNMENPNFSGEYYSGGSLYSSSTNQPSSNDPVDDLSERIKRLSSVPDFNSYQQGLQNGSGYGSGSGSGYNSGNDSAYYNSTQQPNLPPSYSSSHLDDPYSSSQQFPQANEYNQLGFPNTDSDSSEALYQDFGVCEKDENFISDDYSHQMNGRSSSYPTMGHAMYHGERMAYTRNQKLKKKAAKILIPVATTSGGVVAGALGGAAIGAAVTGGVGAPVGLVIGAVVGGSAGCTAGLAATNNKKFDRAMVSSKGYGSSTCCTCNMYLDTLSRSPICCPACQRLVCYNCAVTAPNSETSYCQFCVGSLTTPNYRRVTYTK